MTAQEKFRERRLTSLWALLYVSTLPILAIVAAMFSVMPLVVVGIALVNLFAFLRLHWTAMNTEAWR